MNSAAVCLKCRCTCNDRRVSRPGGSPRLTVVLGQRSNAGEKKCVRGCGGCGAAHSQGCGCGCENAQKVMLEVRISQRSHYPCIFLGLISRRRGSKGSSELGRGSPRSSMTATWQPAKASSRCPPPPPPRRWGQSLARGCVAVGLLLLLLLLPGMAVAVAAAGAGANSRGDCTIETATKDVHSIVTNTMVNKTVFSSDYRVVFFAGVGGTGHHLFQSVVRKCADAGLCRDAPFRSAPPPLSPSLTAAATKATIAKQPTKNHS